MSYEREGGSYHPEDGDTLNSGWVRANESPKMLVKNKRGWSIVVNKEWSDKDFTSSHDPVFIAVYCGGTLVPQTVSCIAHPSTSKRYFFDSEGRRAVTRGWKTYKDNYYYAYSDGTLAVNTTVNGFQVDQNGKASLDSMDWKAQDYSSSTNYLILVNRSAHKVAVYQGSKNNWKQIHYWSCSVGKVIKGKSITPAGNFRVSGYKIYRFGAQSRSFYCTVLSSGNMIHSVQYAHGDSSPVHVVDGRLGYHITNSCIRLLVQNAKWVYNNCHEGTAVIVYNP